MDNITDTALVMFRNHYRDDTITKDAIFDYVYGVLHSPKYRSVFRNNLNREFPRIPFAPDFAAFAKAGAELAGLHLGYETGPGFHLEEAISGLGLASPADYRLTTKKMRLLDGGATLRINDRVSLKGIPPEAHEYQVNGRSPLGWFVDRYYIKRDKRSGILNDPNGWWEDPRDLVTAIRRVVYLSVETVRIVGALPDPIPDL